MNISESVVAELRTGFTHMESGGSLDECLQRLSSMAGRLVDAEGCTIMLLSEKSVDEWKLSDGTQFGDLPGHFKKSRRLPAAVPNQQTEAVNGLDQGHIYKNNMFSSIVLNGKVIGIIHIFNPRQQACFTADDLALFSIITPLIAKSIEVIQLENIVKSRFTQMALSRKDNSALRQLVTSANRNPNQIARILAKSFYREMLNAGFNFNQIIHAATEVISELSAGVRKHSQNQKNCAGQRTTEDIMFAPSDPGQSVELQGPQ